MKTPEQKTNLRARILDAEPVGRNSGELRYSLPVICGEPIEISYAELATKRNLERVVWRVVNFNFERFVRIAGKGASFDDLVDLAFEQICILRAEAELVAGKHYRVRIGHGQVIGDFCFNDWEIGVLQRYDALLERVSGEQPTKSAREEARMSQ